MLLVIGFLVLTVDHLTPYQSAKQGIKESHFEIKMSKREMSLFSVQQTPFFTSFVIVHERDARESLSSPKWKSFGQLYFSCQNDNNYSIFLLVKMVLESSCLDGLVQ